MNNWHRVIMKYHSIRPNVDSRKPASLEGAIKAVSNPFEFLGAHRTEVNITQDELERIEVTNAIIPGGVSTILDVGCRDGRII